VGGKGIPSLPPFAFSTVGWLPGHHFRLRDLIGRRRRRDVAVEQLLVGGWNGMSAKRFAKATGNLLSRRRGWSTPRRSSCCGVLMGSARSSTRPTVSVTTPYVQARTSCSRGSPVIIEAHGPRRSFSRSLVSSSTGTGAG